MSTQDQPQGIDQCYCFTIRKASRQISRLYDSHLEPTGLRITQYLLLVALHHAGSATINALAEKLDVERTAVGKMVGTLERDGLVSAQPSSQDARNRVVELTEKGLQVEAQATPLWREAQRLVEQWNGKENANGLRAELRGLATNE